MNVTVGSPAWLVSELLRNKLIYTKGMNPTWNTAKQSLIKSVANLWSLDEFYGHEYKLYTWLILLQSRSKVGWKLSGSSSSSTGTCSKEGGDHRLKQDRGLTPTFRWNPKGIKSLKLSFHTRCVHIAFANNKKQMEVFNLNQINHNRSITSHLSEVFETSIWRVLEIYMSMLGQIPYGIYSFHTY